MDQFEIREQLNRLRVENQKDDFYQMKLQLEKEILEEILKVEDEDSVNSERLKEVKKLLNDKAKGYTCALTGCRFIGDNHRQYVKHIKINHPRMSSIPCKFRHSCVRNFGNIDTLIKHIKEEHSAVINTPGQALTNRSSGAAADIPCKCNLISCGSKQFSKVKELVKHFNNVHLKEARTCLFDNCNKKFDGNNVSRFHIHTQHVNKGHQLKPVHIVNGRELLLPPVTDYEFMPGPVDENEQDIQTGFDHYDAFGIDEIENAENYCDEIDNEDYFLSYYADFMNRLGHKKFLPHSTIQDIAEEFFRSGKRSQEIRETRLRESLARVADLSDEQVNEVVADVIENDFFLKAQAKLNTQYKRNKYVHDNMKYDAPIEILLNKEEVENGGKREICHYVPIQNSLKTLMEDKTMVAMMERERNRPSGESIKICDIKDGNFIKSNEYFKINKEAHGIILYSDGVEIVNPLGAARGTYKVCQMFYTLADIPKAQRSSVDKLQLCMIFKEKLLKKYSSRIIFQRLIEDLSKLESGLLMNIPEPKICKFGLLLYVADNLEAHTIGGFSASFSSKSVCRH